MRFSFGQELRQEQKQILTQRMIQSMEILQLSTLQLEERIDQELEKNPVLELDMDAPSSVDNDGGTSANDATAENKTLYEHEPEMSFDVSPDTATEEFQIADDFAQNYSDTIDELPARSQNWLEDQDDRRHDAFANIPSPSQTLQDYLSEQLGWFELPPNLLDMVDRIINNLDPNGYFPYEMEEFLSEKLGQNEKIPTPEELDLGNRALDVVRRLDPPGVGGRNLKDCLLLQLNGDIPYAEVIRVLITSHLEDISSNKLPLIARTTGYDLETIHFAIAELKHLNPRPGATFSEKASTAIVPDVIVEKNEDGLYVVRLEEGRSQYLHVNGYYRDMMKDRGTDKDTRNYIKQKVGSAQWLIDAIMQRRATLMKVAQAIVDHQLDFFEIGPQAIKPLKMQQIADVVGVHITTVSRACDEKWMTTPQGVYPMKRFFSGAIAASDGGESVAQDVVRLKLREIIDKEDKNDPLSDDAIVGRLAEAGIQVARRTVVKYRQLMNIPSSRVRKNWGGS